MIEQLVAVCKDILELPRLQEHFRLSLHAYQGPHLLQLLLSSCITQRFRSKQRLACFLRNHISQKITYLKLPQT